MAINQMYSQLSNNDKFNIYNAFSTDCPEQFFRLQQKTKNMNIPDFFNYLNGFGCLDKYINEYSKITDDNEKNRFWLKYKKEK